MSNIFDRLKDGMTQKKQRNTNQLLFNLTIVLYGGPETPPVALRSGLTNYLLRIC